MIKNMSAGFIPTIEPMLNKKTTGAGSSKAKIRTIYSNLNSKIKVEKAAEYFDKIRL